MSFKMRVCNSGYHRLVGGRWVCVSKHLSRLGYGYWLHALRRHRAVLNGTHLTRAHLARRPRAFHPVRVGDNVDVRNLVDGWWFRQTGIVESVLPDWFDSRFVKINSSWWSFAQTENSEYTYVH